MDRSATFSRIRDAKTPLSVGLLTANLMALAGEVAVLQDAGVPMLHLDVMDGRAWPKLTAGAPILAGYRSDLLHDVHLLVQDPGRHIDAFAQAGADMISFAVEEASDIGAVLAQIGNAENTHRPGEPILRGVSLNPLAPPETIRPHLDAIDYAVLLAVGPDTGKETFFDTIPGRIAQLRAWKPGLLVCIDGGIKTSNVGEVAAMGPDFIVTGSAVFDGTDAAENLRQMHEAIHPHRTRGQA
jgi:ribulose-phosphate 3-epimerase